MSTNSVPKTVLRNKKKRIDYAALAEKYITVFQPRVDVFARPWKSKDGKRKGWSPVCDNIWDEDLCRLSKENSLTGNCRNCPNQTFKELDENDIVAHLDGSGEMLGLYLLIPEVEQVPGAENITYSIASDLDNHDNKRNPEEDVRAVLAVAKKHKIICHVERSKSGKGYHIWIFFTEPVPAAIARKAFFVILHEAGVLNPQDHLSSFDRLFPNQDELSGKGLGNLIAAPFCGKYMPDGGTQFVDLSNDSFIIPMDVWLEDMAYQVEHGGPDVVSPEWISEIAALFKDDHPKNTGGFNRNTPLTMDSSGTTCQPITEKCAFIKYCSENAEHLPEPLWADMISNLACFKDGPDVVHKISEMDNARYTKEETDAKIAHLIESSAPITCQKIQDDGFDGCPEGGCGVKSPSGLAYSISFLGQIEADNKNNRYKIASKSGEIAISSFVLEPTERIFSAGVEVLVADIITERGATVSSVQFPRDSFRSKRNFQDALPSLDLQWSGSDANVQGLLRLVSEKSVPKKHGVSVIGYHRIADDKLWVGPGLAMDSSGVMQQDKVVFMDLKNPMATKVQYKTGSHDNANTLKEIYKWLPRINDPAVILPMLGWFFAAPMKPIWKTHGIAHQFPILFVWGTQGSGKTSTLADVLWPLSGVKPGVDPISATQTRFSLLRILSATNGFPVIMDEFKPSDMTPQQVDLIVRMIRRIYGGEIESRGRADQTLVDYHLEAPLVVAGESRPEIPAVLERIVSVNPDKNALDNPSFQEAFHALTKLPLGALTVPYLQFCLQTDPASLMKSAQRGIDISLSHVNFPTPIPQRVRNNLVAMMAGLELYISFGDEIGVDDFGFDSGDVVAAIRTMLSDVLDGEAGVKNGLDSFLEHLSVLAINGELEAGKHYKLKETGNNKNILAIRFRACHQKYIESKSRTGKHCGEVLDYRAIQKQLKENRERGGYVMDTSVTTRFGEETAKSVDIDLLKAVTALDIGGFNHGTGRTPAIHLLKEQSA